MLNKVIYYSAVKVEVCHADPNCPEGSQIPDKLIRRAYLPPTFARKCKMCVAKNHSDVSADKLKTTPHQKV